jgi:hypothetical protein
MFLSGECIVLSKLKGRPTWTIKLIGPSQPERLSSFSPAGLHREYLSAKATGGAMGMSWIDSKQLGI